MSCPAHLCYNIDPSNTFTLEIADVRSSSNVKYLAAFRVSFKVLFDHGTEEFRNMLRSASTESLLVKATNEKALDIIIHYIHELERCTPNGAANYANFKEEYFRVDNQVLYEIIDLAMRWFKIDELRPWFIKFYELQPKRTITLEQMKILMYPCLAFKQAEAFGHLTNAVALKSAGKIIVRNPTPHHRHLALNPLIIKQLHSVRRQIRDYEMPKILVDKMDEFCPSTCGESGACVRMYKQSLLRTKAWPSKQRESYSIEEIPQSEGFKNWTCTIPREASAPCREILLGEHIKAADHAAKHHWDGLCQTCMERSASNAESYWEDDIQKTYGSCCAIKHGKNTWFFSNMRGVNAMSAHKASKKVKKARYNKTDRKEINQKIDRKAGYNKMGRKAPNLSKQPFSTPLDTTEAAADNDLLGPLFSDDVKTLMFPVMQLETTSLPPQLLENT